MKLLLDTRIWLWAVLDSSRLSPTVLAALRSPDNELWLSPVSVWEAMLLVERGRITVQGTPAEWVERMVAAIPRREAALTHDMAITSRGLALAHQDPADQFIAATARVLGLTLVTADERLMSSREYKVLANG